MQIVTASAYQGPNVMGTAMPFFALSKNPSVSCLAKGGSTFWRKEIGKLSP